MEGFRKMPKMGGCDCAVPRMKTGGYVSRTVGHEDQGFKPMKKANGGIISMLDQKPIGKPAIGLGVAPGKPSMAARREAMKVKPKAKPKLDILIAVGKGKKTGGEVKETAKHEAAEKKGVKSVKAELKSHEKLPASKAHKGLKCGGEVKKMAEGGAVQPSLADVWRWNNEFQKMNNIPPQKMNNRGDIAQALATQSYYKTIMGNNRNAGGMSFRSPDDSPEELARINAPRNFEDGSSAPLTWEQSGQGSSQPAPFVSSATPSNSGLGLVNSRLASRNLPPQQPPSNGNGGFFPHNPMVRTPSVPGGGTGGTYGGQLGGGAGGNINTNPIGFLNQPSSGYNKYEPRQAVVQGNRLAQGPSGMKNGGRVK